MANSVEKADKKMPTVDERLIEQLIDQSLARPDDEFPPQRLLAPLLRFYCRPTLVGLENLAEKPVLFVGNHTLFALDAPLILSTLFGESGRFVRALADKLFFENPATGKMVSRLGVNLAHPKVCSTLMQAQKDILVFPGGAHEVNKPVDQLYRLQWKERVGFVRLAAEHGYTIQPFGTVGPDEFFGRYMEGPEWANTFVGKQFAKAGLIDPENRPDLLPPLPRGVFFSMLPKPQRFYMGLGKPVDLSEYKGQSLDDAKLREIRQEVADEIHEQIDDLLLLRTQQRSSDGLLRRFLTS